MTPPTLIIYDDDLGRLGPLTATRAVFEVRTGADTTLNRVLRVIGQERFLVVVPKRLEGVLRSRSADDRVNPDQPPHSACLFVNGRWLGDQFADQVKALSPGQALVQTDGGVIAALLDAPDAEPFMHSACQTLPDNVNTVRAQERVLIDRPWHVLDSLPENLLLDLNATTLPRLDRDRHAGVSVFGDHPVNAAKTARLLPGSVIDAEHGPVVIDADAVVQPLAVLQGPCYVGPSSTIVSHASVRSNTAIGPNCKVGGEVSASIFQAYSNKSHNGYLGDSLVGAWVNLGAGTNGSNLKNTYGPVRVRLDDASEPEDSGRTFHGPIIGDYVRTAIGTRLPTGAVIHTGCVLGGHGWAPKCATPLGFYNDSGRQPYDPDRLIQTLRRIKARRDQTLSAEMQRLLRGLVS